MVRATFLAALLLSLALTGPAVGEGYDAEGGYNWFGDYDDESVGLFDGPGTDDGLNYDSWFVDEPGVDDYGDDYGDVFGDGVMYDDPYGEISDNDVGLGDDGLGYDDVGDDYDLGTDDEWFDGWYDE